MLDAPPYEEQAVGLWNEANFLANSDFDYHRLLYEEPHFMSPQMGSRSYMISIQPTLLALLMKCPLSPRAVSLLWHLLQLVAAAGTFALAANLLRPRMGWWGSLVASAALATTPLFSAQVEQAGMDVTLAFAVTLSVAATARRAYLGAVASTLAAFLLKANGLIATAAVLATFALAWVGRPAGRGRLTRAFLAGTALLGVQLVLLYWGDDSTQIRRLLHVQFAGSSGLFGLPMARIWCPDLVMLVVLATLLAMYRLGLGPRRLEDEDLALVQAGLIVAFTLVATGLYLFTPRHVTMAVPALYLVLGLLATPTGRSARWAGLGFAALVFFNLANQGGRFFPAIGDAGQDDFARSAFRHPRWSILLERSLEYRADHAASLAALAWLEQNADGETALLSYPHYWYATMPCLGYVKRPLDARLAMNYPSALAAMLDIDSKQTPAARVSPLFLWYGTARSFLPPPSVDDEILFVDGLEDPLIIYRKAGRDGEKALAADERYARWHWPGPWRLRRAIDRAQVRADGENARAAARELGRSRDFRRIVGSLEPDIARLTYPSPDAAEYGRELMRAVGEDDAPRAFMTSLVLDCLARADTLLGPEPLSFARHPAQVQFPGTWDVSPAMAAELVARHGPRPLPDARPTGNLPNEVALILARDDWLVAWTEFGATKPAEPWRRITELAIGLELASQGKLGESESHLRRAFELPEARRFLARVLLARGEVAEALTMAQAEQAKAPRDADALLLFGIALARAGQLDQATVALAAATRIDPFDLRARTLFLAALARQWSEMARD